MQAYNPNYIGGEIIGGANDRLQVLFRPRVAIDPYFTGVPGVYLCSQSTPPAPVSTDCAAITPPSWRCAGCAGEFEAGHVT